MDAEESRRSTKCDSDGRALDRFYAYTQVCTLMKPLSSSGGGADETPVTIDIFTSMLHISYCAQVATQVGKLPGQIMTNGRQISVSSLYKLILACT